MSHVAEAAGIGRAAPSRQSHAPLALAPASPAGDPRIDVPLDQVAFRRAGSAADLRRIAHLRDAIALPAHVRDAPAFARLEKKETSWAWWARSSAWARCSARSASCR